MEELVFLLDSGQLSHHLEHHCQLAAHRLSCKSSVDISCFVSQVPFCASL